MKTADEARLDTICRAVADPTRRAILRRLAAEPGATTGDLAAGAPSLTRFAVMKHLAALRDAGLVRTMSQGRRRRHYAEPEGLAPLRSWLAG
jgi:DNA-binding transcriptional ArsR family regulator